MNKERFIKLYIFSGEELSHPATMPSWRKKEIAHASLMYKRDKELIWRALALAVFHCLGISVMKLHPHKMVTGKLVIDKYHVSLSHSGDRFMVGISSHNIGVDIMKNSEYKYYSLIEHKEFWSAGEKRIIYDSKETEPFFYTWTRKEALYKLLNPHFTYKENRSKVDTTQYPEHMYINGSLEGEEHFFAAFSKLLYAGVEPEIITNLKVDQ